MIFVRVLLIFLCICTYILPANAGNEERRIIVGYVERMLIPNLDLSYRAKMDTGATTSSIHAEIIEINENKTKEDKEETDSKGSIVFALETEKGKSKNLRKPIKRWVKIKLKEDEEEFIRRPVVEMTFCIAGQLITGEVNLSDRDHFNYDVLIGRNMMSQGQLVIDPSKTYTTKAKCPVLEEEKSS